MFNSINIANYFIGKSFDEGVQITPMKVLKLVYIAHGWHLGLFDKRLISDQAEAWKFGPVIEPVYQAFKHYRSDDIQSMVFYDNSMKNEFYELYDETESVNFLNSVWDFYKQFTGGQLSDLTHQENTPWSITVSKNGGVGNNLIIPDDLIKAHYKEKINSVATT